MPRIPTLIFSSARKGYPDKYLSPNRTSDAPLIIVLPLDTRDPSRKDRKLIDIFQVNTLCLTTFARRLIYERIKNCFGYS
jgi:hypothetical protein